MSSIIDYEHFCLTLFKSQSICLSALAENYLDNKIKSLTITLLFLLLTQKFTILIRFNAVIFSFMQWSIVRFKHKDVFKKHL